MKAKRLLHHLRHGILNDRSNNVGPSSDHLWPDEDLIDYMNEAYRRMAVEGIMLRDAVTPEVTQLTLVEGQRDYPLHEAVVSVLSARVSSTQFDLASSDHSTLAAKRRPSDGWWNPSYSQSLPPGMPLVYSTDEGMLDTASNSLEQMTFRILPIPDSVAAGEVILLRVIRKPLTWFSCEDLEYEPELPREWQMPMLDWAAYLALRIVDDDAGAPARAAEFQASFEANVIKSRNQIIAKLKQGQGWGFGRGGFSWETGNGW